VKEPTMTTATSLAPPTEGFGIRKVLDRSFAEALERVPEALRAEGFGILTEIDVRGTLREKLGIDFRPYRILGACNPPLAHRALQAELEVGLMLPCNVVVYEADDGRAVVIAIDPMQTVAARGNPEIRKVAETVREKLRRALEALS
jgi:uncharacterized protein (DUF302 family)